MISSRITSACNLLTIDFDRGVLFIDESKRGHVPLTAPLDLRWGDEFTNDSSDDVYENDLWAEAEEIAFYP